jgi:hypothetical protein
MGGKSRFVEAGEERAFSAVDPGGQETSKLELRLPARAQYSALLRAQLRLWLAANCADGDERDVFDILAAATRAFLLTLAPSGPVRTIVVDVEGLCANGVVELAVTDHAGPGGNTARVDHVLAAVPRLRARGTAQPIATP